MSGTEGTSPGPVLSVRGRWQASGPQAPCPHAEATLGPHLHRLHFCTGSRLCSRDPLGHAAQGPSSPLCLHPAIRHPSFPGALHGAVGGLPPRWVQDCNTEDPQGPHRDSRGGGWASGRERQNGDRVGFQERECLCGRKQESTRAGHLQGLAPPRGIGDPGGTSAAGAHRGQSSEGSGPGHRQQPLVLASWGAIRAVVVGGAHLEGGTHPAAQRRARRRKLLGLSLLVCEKGARAPSLKNGSGGLLRSLLQVTCGSLGLRKGISCFLLLERPHLRACADDDSHGCLCRWTPSEPLPGVGCSRSRPRATPGAMVLVPGVSADVTRAQSSSSGNVS